MPPSFYKLLFTALTFVSTVLGTSNLLNNCAADQIQTRVDFNTLTTEDRQAYTDARALSRGPTFKPRPRPLSCSHQQIHGLRGRPRQPYRIGPPRWLLPKLASLLPLAIRVRSHQHMWLQRCFLILELRIHSRQSSRLIQSSTAQSTA
jgi:hypothetical protein